VVDPLPDERRAADALNAVLDAAGAAPRLHPVDGRWRVVAVDGSGEPGELVAAACGLADLVAAAGWRRLKRCEACGEVFVDRTNGCSRRWCARHRAHPVSSRAD
jgi:predicted RNA-binding Zn ribbon-like protein